MERKGNFGFSLSEKKNREIDSQEKLKKKGKRKTYI